MNFKNIFKQKKEINFISLENRLSLIDDEADKYRIKGEDHSDRRVQNLIYNELKESLTKVLSR